ncbi:MAG: 50S ribosomal protein L32e [Candidatus Hecatellales archaeon]|nr:MAG: 50S ribosomal protein L32e [Candidatus Hecatellales archaeon]
MAKLPEAEKARRKLSRQARRLRREKPEFVRQESWRYKRVKPSWRRPRGIDSKMRLARKGWPASPNPGYRSPKALRGLHPSSFMEALVSRVEDLKTLNPKVHAVRIAGGVGRRKRLQIFSEAKNLGFKVLNPPKLVEEAASR